MLGVANSTERVNAERRLLYIRYTVRTKQWWRTRQALHEATGAEDWRVLGYPTEADYRSAALRTAPAPA
jgi:hypothetical protein